MLFNFILNRLAALNIPTQSIFYLNNYKQFNIYTREIIANLITWTALTLSAIIIASLILLLFKWLHSLVHKWGDK